MGQYQTFVVRLWQDAAPERVHGHIQHVASRRAIYFRDVDRMLAFMRDCSDHDGARVTRGGGDFAPPGEDCPTVPEAGAPTG